MRKICILFIILILICTTQVFALEAWGERNKKMDEAVNSTLKEYMEPYKAETVPENERVISYQYRGGSFDYSKEDEGILKISIQYDVEPYSKENTIWRLMDNYLFVTYSIVDDNYVVKEISETPENYDKFLERFEEYKKNGNKNVEVQTVQGEKMEDINSSKEIEKMSNIIFIVSAITFAVIIIFSLVKLRGAR